MRIVKPYGRSVTRNKPGDNQGAPERMLAIPKSNELDSERQPLCTLKDNPRFIIAQWISTIDKIITKPKSGGLPTENQAENRKKLGCTAWKVIKERDLLALSKDEHKDGYADDQPFYKIWCWKLHPYWPDKSLQKPIPNGANCKGRWYDPFIGDKNPENLPDEVLTKAVEKIYQHLYKQRQHLKPLHKERCQKYGKIDAQLRAVQQSGLPRHEVTVRESGEDLRTLFNRYGNNSYRKHCDFVQCIYDCANLKLGGKEKSRSKIKNCVFETLYAYYGEIFGKDTTIEMIPENKKELFKIHEMVKSAYRDILRRNKVEATQLPADKEGLFQLIESRQKNQDIAQLIRLGKIIHYSFPSLETKPDKPHITGSAYWLSDGQAEIKRNEALVRIWKLSISLANHSLCFWVQKEDGNDIFTGNTAENLENIDLRQVQDQAKKIFGVCPDADAKELLGYAIESWKNLRNNSFHFKNRSDFIQALENTQGNDDPKLKPCVKNFIEKLWENDHRSRLSRVKNTLQALKCHEYMTQEQLKKFYEAVSLPATTELTLPRFNRILANNTNNGLGNAFPEAARKAVLEKDDALRCRYSSLKLLYERTFPNWIATIEPSKLKGYIEESIKRSDKASKSINKSSMAESRSRNMVFPDSSLANTDFLTCFFQAMSAETATEFRIQRGYGQDIEQVKKHAAYIEKHKMDVFGYAFHDFLTDDGWGFLQEDLKKQDGRKFQLPAEEKKSPEDGEFWTKRLYFMLFMIPAGEVSKLLHQLLKWHTLTLKTDSGEKDEPRKLMQQCRNAMQLYLDMHDARFSGGENMKVPCEMKALFEKDELFSEIYGVQKEENQIHTLPIRGLREILRFGLSGKLFPIYEEQKISCSHKTVLNQMDEKSEKSEKSKIEEAHDNKERLHKDWINKKNPLDKEYGKAVGTITKYREAAAHLRFTNHIDLYHLMMAVLARIIDYAGLWERDLYFVTRALMYQKDCLPEDAFNGDGLKWLKRGQIVEALNKQKCDDIKKTMAYYFGEDYLCHQKETRNSLSHLNMLRDSSCPLNLTDWVNKTRKLMAYDRKLKNSVSQSIMELFSRENLCIRWEMKNHALVDAEITPKSIRHLHLGRSCIRENLHSEEYCHMAAQLMGGKIGSILKIPHEKR